MLLTSIWIITKILILTEVRHQLGLKDKFSFLRHKTESGRKWVGHVTWRDSVQNFADNSDQ